MSQETIEWLNQNVLSGFGRQPWHRDVNFLGAEDNVYPGAIPVADIQRRLFNFSLESRRMFMEVPCSVEEATGIGDNGEPIKLVLQDDLQAIARDDTNLRMGLFTQGYAKHPYMDWLVHKVSNVIGDTLAVGSAGLLKGGKVAWVSIEIPEYLRKSPSGVEIQPRLLSVTSCDGSKATTYKMVITNTVCDNTMGAALAESGAQEKFKHTKYSDVKSFDTARALGLIQQTGDSYVAEAERLLAVKVTDKQFQKYLDLAHPIPTDKGRAQTSATKRQDGLKLLWTNDNRVTPWARTAFGVVQAVNTFDHHLLAGVKGIRPERNLVNTIKGEFDKLDLETLDVLGSVLDRDLIGAAGRQLVAA